MAKVSLDLPTTDSGHISTIVPPSAIDKELNGSPVVKEMNFTSLQYSGRPLEEAEHENADWKFEGIALNLFEDPKQF